MWNLGIFSLKEIDGKDKLVFYVKESYDCIEDVG